MSLRPTSLLPVFLALGSLLGACSRDDQPLAPNIGQPQFSQMAAGAAGRIAFHSNRDGPFQIYSMNPDGSDVVRLTFSGVNEFLPLWSPDASRITFGRCFGDHCDVVVIDANGGNERTVLSNAFPGAWSPDGNRIAVGAPGGVFIVGVYDSGLVKISDLPAVRGWSADGRQLMLVGPDADGDDEIWAYNFDGSGTVQLTHNTARDGSETFSNDDNRIIYTSDLDGPDDDIFVMNRDGSGVTDISNDDGIDEYDGVFSPSDGQIAFTSNIDGDEDIYVMNADGTGVVNITNNDGVADAGPSWALASRNGPPVASFFFFPSDPSIFDAVQFIDNSFDPGGFGIATRAWQFGDGGTGTDCCPTHRYAADGSYTIQLTVTTPDGRTASTSQPVVVRTHDVAITRLQAPSSGMTGKTSRISIDILSNRYAETVEVQLLKSVPGGFQLVATSRQTLPTRNRVTSVLLSYTFTSADATIGKVTFKAVASLLGARDALPADNEAIAFPTKVTR